MPFPPQTIHVQSILQAQRLVDRLCRGGYRFTCQPSDPLDGRWITIPGNVQLDNTYLFRNVTITRLVLKPPTKEPV